MLDFFKPLRVFDGAASDMQARSASSRYWDARAVTWDDVEPPLVPNQTIVAAYTDLLMGPKVLFHRDAAHLLVLGSTHSLVSGLLPLVASAGIDPALTSVTLMDSSEGMLMKGFRCMQGTIPFAYSPAVHLVRKEWVHGISTLTNQVDLVVADGSFNVISTGDYRPLLRQLLRVIGYGGALAVRFYDRAHADIESANEGVARLSRYAERADRASRWDVSVGVGNTTTYSFPPLSLFIKLLDSYGFLEYDRVYAHHDNSRMFPIILFRQAE